MYKDKYINHNKKLLKELLCDYSEDIDYSLKDFNSKAEFYINSLI